MIYDLIIIGAGAAGLFAAANVKLPSNANALILEKSKLPGRKLLMSGGGQCNLTHDGDIKDFITHYGPNGKKIRPILFGFNNDSLRQWFSEHGLKTFSREDGKVFPETLSAQSVLDILLDTAKTNGFNLKTSCSVNNIDFITMQSSLKSNLINNYSESDTDSLTNFCETIPDKKVYRIITSVNSKTEVFYTHKLLIACGGCSYPTSGSDGSIYDALKPLNLEIMPCAPALVPLRVENYPYSELSGVSVKGAQIRIYPGSQPSKKAPSLIDDVLMTHKDFSGPAILNMSRYAEKGHTLEINWYPAQDSSIIYNEINSLRATSKKQIITLLSDYFAVISQSHLRALCARASITCDSRLSDIKADTLKRLIRLITCDTFKISGTAGFTSAMATSGGVSLKELQLSSMESKTYPGLYFAGETLDVDGDTGGYNLQFAFSSSYKAAGSLY